VCLTGWFSAVFFDNELRPPTSPPATSTRPRSSC
jgi:hypothetical protein